METFETRKAFEAAVNEWLAATSMKHRKPAQDDLDFDIAGLDAEFYLVATFTALDEVLDIRVRATEFMPATMFSGAMLGGH